MISILHKLVDFGFILVFLVSCYRECSFITYQYKLLIKLVLLSLRDQKSFALFCSRMARLPCNIRVKHKNRYAQSIQDLRKHLYRNFQLDRTFGTMFFEKVGRTNGRKGRHTAARSNTMPFGHRKRKKKKRSASSELQADSNLRP